MLCCSGSRTCKVNIGMCKDAQRSCKFGFSVGVILGLTVKLVKKIWLIENSSVYLKTKNSIILDGFPLQLDVAS